MKSDDIAEPNYNPTPHLLAFVDALGFSGEISRADAGRVQEYFQMVDHVRRNWATREGKGEQLKVTTIGDSVVLAIESKGDKSDGQLKTHDEHFFNRLYNLCYAVGELQVGLALLDVWTRGAITYDFCHFGANRIVGPAFHRAYFLESKVARFPRVILDGQIATAASALTFQEVIDGVNKQGTKVLHDFQFDPTPYDSKTSKSPLPRDVPTFVDFAHVSVDAYGAVPFVVETAAVLTNRLNGSVEHYEKYRWIADYLLHFAETNLHVKAINSFDVDTAKWRLRN